MVLKLIGVNPFAPFAPILSNRPVNLFKFHVNLGNCKYFPRYRRKTLQLILRNYDYLRTFASYVNWSWPVLEENKRIIFSLLYFLNLGSWIFTLIATYECDKCHIATLQRSPRGGHISFWIALNFFILIA